MVIFVSMHMAKATPSLPPKKLFSKPIVKIAVAATISVAVLSVVILVFLRPQAQTSPKPQFTIVSKSDWWTPDENSDGIGGEQVLHVNITVKNYGEIAGVCQLSVKVEEPGGRSWIRFRIISVSSGDTVEEQFDFPEVVNENVEYSAWLTDL